VSTALAEKKNFPEGSDAEMEGEGDNGGDGDDEMDDGDI
jgi:hypothetical protein